MKHLSEYIYEQLNNSLEINGFCILKPEFLEYEEQWLDLLKNKGWQIVQKTKCKLTNEQAHELYKPHENKDFYEDLCKYMISDYCICCSCHKKCDDPIKEMSKLKDVVRDKWGKTEMKNAMHSSDSLENVNREIKIVFN